mmetsp:Transcript_111335/g.270484  ORF Transcript_111335/g.270484 Transcript_111335/m.270484 type:complete len:178 (+) Transcript_111335:90-623(+)
MWKQGRRLRSQASSALTAPTRQLHHKLTDLLATVHDCRSVAVDLQKAILPWYKRQMTINRRSADERKTIRIEPGEVLGEHEDKQGKHSAFQYFYPAPVARRCQPVVQSSPSSSISFLPRLASPAAAARDHGGRQSGRADWEVLSRASRDSASLRPIRRHIRMRSSSTCRVPQPSAMP